MNKASPLFLAASLFLAAAQSLAQEAPQREPAEPAERERPWSKGVPLEARMAATELFNQGKNLYRESLFFLAAEKYRAALARCSCHHPAAHYNLALSLVSLDQPVEMHENLVAAIENRLDLLSKEHFNHAKNYKAVLESQLVRFRVRCGVPGARVTLDGQELFSPPGESERWAKAGHHVVAASKDGFIANQVARNFAPGSRPTLELRLSTQEDLTVYQRRWSQALPWSVVGSGAAVALAGGGLYYAARLKAIAAENGVRGQCPNGCASAPSGDAGKRSQRDGLQMGAMTGFAVGGAGILTGVVLAILNRAHPSVRGYEPDVAPSPQPILSFAPLLDNSTRGVVAVGQF